jgi:riboflavin synthase
VFTGLVEVTGRVARKTAAPSGFRIAIATEIGPLTLGESVSVNGACLTVAAMSKAGFEADVSAETVVRTNLGGLAVGSEVNLERALALGDRLGGHLVSGHVDAVVSVVRTANEGETKRASIELPKELAPYVAEKGSVVLDGVSLTVNRVDRTSFDILLIPHTLTRTNLREMVVGTKLNLEVDLLARYVVRYFEALRGEGGESGLEEKLRRAGFTR